jgi:hypothetical protein
VNADAEVDLEAARAGYRWEALPGRVKRADKREAYARRARAQFDAWLPTAPTAPQPPVVIAAPPVEVRP